MIRSCRASCKLINEQPKGTLPFRASSAYCFSISKRSLYNRTTPTSSRVHVNAYPDQTGVSIVPVYYPRTISTTYDYNVRIAELGRQGKVDEARQVFDAMPHRDEFSYSTMISIYIRNNEFPKAEFLFSVTPEGVRGVVVNSSMVHAYARDGRVDRAREIFDWMPERNAFSWTNLISGYFKVGRVGEALEVFRKMPDEMKNVVTWTNVIVGLAENRMIDEARAAFDQMPVKNVVTWTSMIKVYVENGMVDEAFKLFREMPERNLFSWNIMISALLDSNRVDDAMNLFDSMPWRNSISWTCMVTGLGRNGMTDMARNYFDHMPNKDIAAWNAMIKVYTDEGCMTEASELFRLMSKKNIVTWNAIMYGYAKDKQEDEAYRHFILMRHNGIKPNELSLTSLLISCSGISGVLQVHGLIMRLGFHAEIPLANTLINMYFKNGDLTSAQITFENIETKNMVSWTSMILAYSNHGFGIQALQAFARMLRSGHSPDEVTFIGILSACSHAGLVKKGRMLFDSMQTAYGLEPMPEHYSCLVDILGRAGLLKDAVNVVLEMPPEKYDSVVLGALVGACRLHGHDRLADHLGEKLIELDPDNYGSYALLANVYAASGKWEKFSQIRKQMNERNMVKVPGFSQIEVNGRSHLFLVGGRCHPEMNEIYMLLEEKLLPVMQDKVDHVLPLQPTLSGIQYS